jgi:hypothetical protein
VICEDVKEQLWKVISAHQRDRDKKLPIFLMSYRVSVHETTGTAPTSIVLGREVGLSCDLLFGGASNRT